MRILPTSLAQPIRRGLFDPRSSRSGGAAPPSRPLNDPRSTGGR